MKIYRFVLAAVAFATLLAGGCASPGPPLPPSLKLPEVAAGLSASRAGDQVTLRWTTPSRTTDKLLIKDPITAEICRDLVPLVRVRPRSRRPAAPCTQAARVRVSPGESQALDTLPEPLASGAPRVLAYRVELLNPAGRTAGPAGPVFVAAGQAPAPVENLRATPTKAGVVLEWTPQQTAAADIVQLDRTLVTKPSQPAHQNQTGGLNLLAMPKSAAVVQLRPATKGAGQRDPGGMVDRTAEVGQMYSYTAQRVWTVTIGSRTLELRSPASAEVTVAVNDVFPPEAPAGLVAAPGFAAAAQGQPPKPTIDLSWEPDVEPHLAGYRVYRREANGTWKPLTSELLRIASYSDANVVAGQTYAYRVVAVSDAGVESPPSSEIQETAPSQ